MSIRVLSREERESLSPEAAKIAYRHLLNRHYTPEIMEKSLLQAVMVARLNQCLVDEETFSFLIEKISEYEGLPLIDQNKKDEDAAHGYC
ncbi:MAG: hypothetical protein LBS75_04725 [Synergistaceae bacterium]|jgi:hypothetical protein|nr:hypothetical protein [Synergistaceae bacterium]